MRPCAHVLTIGNEVLKGTVLNTNARFLGRELTGLGFEVLQQSSCRDVTAEITSSLAQAMRHSDLILLTGGLGPTPDDLTREAVAEYFGVSLRFSKRQFDFIKHYYRKRKKQIPEMVRKEAYFPENSEPLFNRFGIALGFYIAHEGKTVIVLPGVPFELEKMFQHQVLPVLKRRFPHIDSRYSLIARTVGLSEPAVMTALGNDFFKEPFDFGIYPHPGEATLRIYAESPKVVARIKSKVQARLGDSVYSWDETSLSAAVGLLLKRKKATLAIAESCTGGLLSSIMTQNPGASGYFRGAVIVYHKDLKKWIGASHQALKKGSVSFEVAGELASAIRSSLKADYGISITGVAGPKPEDKQPVGRVYIGLATPFGVFVSQHDFIGERVQIQAKAAVRALEILWKSLRKK